MEWIKVLLNSIEGLEEDKQKKIIESFNAEFPKHAVPKEQYAKKVNELTAVNEQLEASGAKVKELSDSIAEMSDSTEEVKKLKEDLAKVNVDFESFKKDATTRETNFTKLSKVKDGLRGKFAEDSIDLLANTFKLDELTLNEAGEIVDFETRLSKLAEARPSLVIEKKTSGDKPKGGEGSDDSDLDDAELRKAMGLPTAKE